VLPRTTTTGFIVASPSDSASKLVPGGTAHIHSHAHTYVRYEAGLSVPGEKAASYRIDRDYTLCWVLAGTNEPKQLTTEKIDPRACSLLFVYIWLHVRRTMRRPAPPPAGSYVPALLASIASSRPTLAVCLVVERWERSGANPHFGDGSNPFQVWLEMLGWSGSDPLFCLVGELRLRMDGSFHSVSGSHMS
jgi:hypothetical protein